MSPGYAPQGFNPATGNPLAHPTAAAMSPPLMSPPPGTAMFPQQRPQMRPTQGSSLPGRAGRDWPRARMMFVATCSAVHARAADQPPSSRLRARSRECPRDAQELVLIVDAREARSPFGDERRVGITRDAVRENRATPIAASRASYR